MKYLMLSFILVFWIIITVLLSLSIIGWVILLPVPNNTNYYKPMTDSRRSAWMLIGLSIKDKLLEKL